MRQMFGDRRRTRIFSSPSRFALKFNARLPFINPFIFVWDGTDDKEKKRYEEMKAKKEEK